jgi:hypothetical protein
LPLDLPAQAGDPPIAFAMWQFYRFFGCLAIARRPI